MSSKKWRNWSGSVRCKPNHISAPLSVEEVQAEVLRCAEEGERLRVIGRGGSFAPLCWSDENLMSLEHYRGIERVDFDARQAWVRAGTPLRDLARQLGDYGLSLPWVHDSGAATVGGLLATGSHASGLQGTSLADHVLSLRMVCADGSVRSFSAGENAEGLPAVRLALGVLGVITHVQLQCVTPLRLHSRVAYRPLREQLREAVDHARQHLSYRCTWVARSSVAQVHSLDVTEAPADPVGNWHWLGEVLAADAGRWALATVQHRLPAVAERAGRLRLRRPRDRDVVRSAAHYPADPRLHRYNEVEYYVGLAALPELLRRLERMLRSPRLDFPLSVSLRFCRADAAWLAPAHARDSAAIGLRFDPQRPAAPLLAALEPLFADHAGRPHWGKLHSHTAATLSALYPQWQAFGTLRQQLDPRGVFLNPHTKALFGVPGR